MDPRAATQPGDATAHITIVSQYIRCEKSFDKLIGKLNESDAQEIQDVFGRFRVWAGNAGVARTGRASLAYRLQEATHIHTRLTQFLTELNEALVEGDFFPAVKRLELTIYRIKTS